MALTAQARYHAGFAAEECVARDYERRGQTIANRRWRCAGGEVDLIVREGDTVVFVEVKKSTSHAQAALRLGRTQMDRISAAASKYIGSEPNGQMTEVRFDLATVDGQGTVRIIENAFTTA